MGSSAVDISLRGWYSQVQTLVEYRIYLLNSYLLGLVTLDIGDWHVARSCFQFSSTDPLKSKHMPSFHCFVPTCTSEVHTEQSTQPAGLHPSMYLCFGGGCVSVRSAPSQTRRDTKGIKWGPALRP